MEVTYLRLEHTNRNIERLYHEPFQQIIYVGKNQYHTDVIMPKTPFRELDGIVLGRDEFWSDNMSCLIRTTVKPCWSNGQPKVSVDFNSDNLLTILKLCGTIQLQYGYRVFNIDDKVTLHKSATIQMHILSGKQEYNMGQFEVIQSVLKNARETIINTYEDQLIKSFQHQNTIYKLEV